MLTVAHQTQLAHQHVEAALKARPEAKAARKAWKAFATRLEAHFSTLVEHGHHLDTVVQSLAGAAEGGQAPVPVLRVLGDAYVRTDQLQKALDTYRQALRRL